MLTRSIIPLFTLCLLSACSSDEGNKNESSSAGAAGKPSGAGGSGNPSTPGSGGNKTNFGGGPTHVGPMSAGAECPDVGLPDAYGLPNVKGVIEGNNVRITFDPQADARDYRVYALPAKGDVKGDAIQGAVYRCAGESEVPFAAVDDAKTPANPGIRTRAETTVAGVERKAADATLGYVFTTPGDDRVPVYALGDPHIKADNVDCYWMRWPESRVKKYTTSETERAELISQRWRDDGIVFYAPKAGTEGSEVIYTASEKPGDFSATFYFKDGAERTKRSDLKPSEAFSVYSEAQDGAEPLMRVFYSQTCGRGHDELVPGVARFNKAHQQGPQPVTELHYAGLTEETTLVVEALDALCPFQGVLSTASRAAHDVTFGDEIIEYAPMQTAAELMAASSNGELFISGQGTGTSPKAISRACLKVAPEKPAKMDFLYDGGEETFGDPVEAGYQTWSMESASFDAAFYSVETNGWAIGSQFGELWATYSDVAADTNGKLRITPKARATLAADSFVHATMEVDAVSSQRRYPQLLVSSAEWPVQENLEKAATVVVQVFGGVTQALELQIEFCDHRTWDVNNQCPIYPLYTLKDGADEFVAPAPEMNQFVGTDKTLRLDAYVSTNRIYVYTNGKPYGCADLPPGKLPAGTGTVTFGDALYHSAVDLEAWYKFHVAKMQVVTSRHFSNLGFSSGVPEPGWNESVLPCVAPIK